MNTSTEGTLSNSCEEAPSVPLPKVDDTILPPSPQMYVSKTIAETLGLSANTVRQMLRENKIRSIKVGQQYRVPRAWLIEFIESGGQK